jgi:hypothetical protein
MKLLHIFTWGFVLACSLDPALNPACRSLLSCPCQPLVVLRCRVRLHTRCCCREACSVPSQQAGALRRHLLQSGQGIGCACGMLHKESCRSLGSRWVMLGVCYCCQLGYKQQDDSVLFLGVGGPVNQQQQQLEADGGSCGQIQRAVAQCVLMQAACPTCQPVIHDRPLCHFCIAGV